MNRYVLAGVVVAIVTAVIAALRSATSHRNIKTDFVPQSVLDRIRSQNDASY